ncbi:MAG TPA: ATP-binding protein [Gemmatimonadaceae bacterium]|nr:ATP-binding protein [Gemmatimonadaceae bacterium]
MTSISDPARLAVLRRTALLDSPPEPAFDRLTEMAASLLRAPIALFSLVEKDRQFLKSAIGLDEPLASRRETPISFSLCAVIVDTGEPLILQDTRTHPLTRNRGAVRELGIASCAGAPVATRDGHVLGAICALDRVPRVWTLRDVETLTTLAQSASAEVSLRLLGAGRSYDTRSTALVREREGDAHSMLSTLVSAAPQAIIAVDLDWRVTLWNGTAEQLFGWTADEVMGRPIPFLSREQIAELRTMEGPSSRPHGAPGTAMRHVRKDGSHVDTLFSTGVLRDAAGATAGYIAVITDLTEHKLLEAQLRQSQKMEAVGQLAGGVAHDFNNLLTVIKAHTFIALEGLPEDAPARADLVAVNKAAGRAADLTRRLLAFSRKQLLQPRVLDLNAAVSGVLPMLERLIGEDIEVVTQLDPSLHTVSADPAQLEQVIMNLAVNARDAMPHGGVFRIGTINVELLAPRAVDDGFTMQPGSYVVLEVGDTGVGMDAATRARIFEPFFTTKEQGKGTGLGLAMVYGIVKQSGGYVRAESEPGMGTRFEIWLPRVESNDAAAPRAEHRVAPRGGTETVLVVEDEQAVRHVVKRVLELQGYTVFAARNGYEALRVAREREGRIDLVMTDVVLPEMSGPAIVERLLAEWPHAKVLYMSGYAAEEATKRGLLEPGTALLKKPFTLDELARAVRGVLG